MSPRNRAPHKKPLLLAAYPFRALQHNGDHAHIVTSCDVTENQILGGNIQQGNSKASFFLSHRHIQKQNSIKPASKYALNSYGFPPHMRVTA